MAIEDGVEWTRWPGLSPYLERVDEMEARAAAIRAHEAPEAAWLLEHPPLYTAGTSAVADELVDPGRFPVYRTGRGGRYTYHGPGQRVGYLMLDLERRGRDVRRYVHALEDWLIRTLRAFGVDAHTDPERIGLWVDRGGTPAKVGAIGVRVRRWVTLHGFSLNLEPDLSHFTGIVPCGISQFPVTSLAEMGLNVSAEAFDQALFREFPPFLASFCRDAADA